MEDAQQQFYEPLTARELEILQLMAAGLTNQQIADQLVLTVDTVKWHNKQTYQKLHVRSRTQAIARIRALGLLDTAETRQSATRQNHNLPTQTTSFIGREGDIAQIKQLLLDEPACRLLTLIGPGGIGKSRLALAAAFQMVNAFADGVYFVPLAAIDDIAYIVPTIAEVLHFTFFGNTELAEQLLKYLRPKRLLLVLDNFEHLLDGASLLADILKHGPDVKLLTTSRERLRLQEEWNYQVQGLTYPTGDPIETDIELESYEAIQLFMHRARQAGVRFAPDAGEVLDIIHICRLVEGMPLGLELAAAWTRLLSCHDIALEIQYSLDFLATASHNLPERHRSVRAVIDQTWQRLSLTEQSVLRQLSVFRGGCTRQAAQAVTGATLVELSSLIDKAMLRRTDTGRYELHELIRQFGEAQLQADPDAAEQTQQRHTDFFITFLEQRTAGVKGGNQQATLAEIARDLDNVRLAWRRAVKNHDAEAVNRSAESLFIYHLYGNGYDEGYSEFGRAANAFMGPADLLADDDWAQKMVVSIEQETLVGYLLAAHGYFLAHRRDLKAGQKVIEQAITLIQRRDTVPKGILRQRVEAFALGWLGWALLFQGLIVESERCARESLALFTEVADHWGAGWSGLLLSNCKKGYDPIEAERGYRNGLGICKLSGDQAILSYLSFNLGNVLCYLGRYAQAAPYIDRGIAISEAMQNVLGLAYGLRYRGELHIVQGEYQQAIQTLEQAIAHFNEVGTVHAGRARVYLGIALHRNGEYTRAAQSFTRALDEFEYAKSQFGLGDCLNGLGALAQDQGDWQQAVHYYRAALTIFQDTEMDIGIAATLRNLGRVLAIMGEPYHAEAIQCWRQALEIAVHRQLAPIALAVCVDVAILRLQTGSTKQALELLSFAEQHEASTFETRKKARQALVDWIDHKSAETIAPAQATRTQRTLWPVVAALLSELPRTDTEF